jgi:hypothetical protein
MVRHEAKYFTKEEIMAEETRFPNLLRSEREELALAMPVELSGEDGVGSASGSGCGGMEGAGEKHIHR